MYVCGEIEIERERCFCFLYFVFCFVGLFGEKERERKKEKKRNKRRKRAESGKRKFGTPKRFCVLWFLVYLLSLASSRPSSAPLNFLSIFFFNSLLSNSPFSFRSPHFSNIKYLTLYFCSIACKYLIILFLISTIRGSTIINLKYFIGYYMLKHWYYDGRCSWFDRFRSYSSSWLVR